MNRGYLLHLCLPLLICSGCGTRLPKTEPQAAAPQQAPSYFKIDPATAGTLSGVVHFTGRPPSGNTIDMDQDPDCARLHRSHPVIDNAVVVTRNGGLANAFVYLKAGLEGKQFAPPVTPATIDQNGCWFQPRVLGIQTGQPLRVTNSDPVTHNIHPLAQVNREWNHSQSSGDPPLSRRFTQREIMIRVKCNIHRWMRAFIGVVDHPYFAVTGPNGEFELPQIPPGTYTLAAWHETLGEQEQVITVGPSAKVRVAVTFKGE